jgi:hypothetical protein
VDERDSGLANICFLKIILKIDYSLQKKIIAAFLESFTVDLRGSMHLSYVFNIANEFLLLPISNAD